MNYNVNAIFGPNRMGLIQLRSGGELELKESDQHMIDDEGNILIVHGNDRYRSVTLVPRNNIAYVRTRDVSEVREPLELDQQRPELDDRLELEP